MFKAKITSRIKFPDVDLTPTLKEIADKIVIKSLTHNIKRNTDIYGKRFSTLEPSTILAKGRSNPLRDEDILMNSFKKRTEGDHVVVYIDGARKKTTNHKIAKALQIDGVGKKNKHFYFFGVTDGMEKDAMNYMTKKIGKWLRDANRG